MLHKTIVDLHSNEYMAIINWRYGTNEIHLHKIYANPTDATKFIDVKLRACIIEFINKYTNHRQAAYSHGVIDADKIQAIANIKFIFAANKVAHLSYGKLVMLLQQHWAKLETIAPTADSMFYNCWHTGLNDLKQLLPNPQPLS